VIDLVSYSPGAFDDALKPGARVVSSNGAAGDGPGRTNVMAIASRENVERVARRLADRTLNLHIQERYPFERTPEALYRLRTEHTRGKLAIRVAG
jgi:NADPH:quinone reductase-like Zn-dependent oxidoreductase